MNTIFFFDGPLAGTEFNVKEMPDKLMLTFVSGKGTIRYECDMSIGTSDVNCDKVKMRYRMVLTRNEEAFNEEMRELL